MDSFSISPAGLLASREERRKERKYQREVVKKSKFLCARRSQVVLNQGQQRKTGRHPSERLLLSVEQKESPAENTKERKTAIFQREQRARERKEHTSASKHTTREGHSLRDFRGCVCVCVCVCSAFFASRNSIYKKQQKKHTKIENPRFVLSPSFNSSASSPLPPPLAFSSRLSSSSFFENDF